MVGSEKIDTLLLERLGRVAVLHGGVSAEREVSLESGAAVIRALSEMHIDVVPVDIQDNAMQHILHAKADRAFIALHGPGGEDGKTQALLEMLNLPYTGSGVSGSSLAMDKLRSKQLLCGVGLPTPEYAILEADTDWATTLSSLGGVVFVKPAHEGSSLGMSKVDTPEAFYEAYLKASRYDHSVIAERFIRGAEYTVSILNGSSLPSIRLQTSNPFFDYQAKYRDESTQYFCPSGLSTSEEKHICQLALDTFSALGAAGWGRVDFMQDLDGKFYILELNTVPGLTSHSLVPMAAKAAGYNFNELVLAILRQTLST